VLSSALEHDSFNKRPDDFVTLREYNDYLEEVEDIIYNLVNDIDVQETNEKVNRYREKNLKSIQANKLRKEEEERRRRVEKEMKQKAEFGRDIGASSAEAQPQVTTAQKPDIGYVPQQVPTVQFRQPQPKEKEPKITHKAVDEETIRLRMQAGGYSREYPLLRARMEASQTVF
jgi:CDK-activating kinase assembly factor MAT1